MWQPHRDDLTAVPQAPEEPQLRPLLNRAERLRQRGYAVPPNWMRPRRRWTGCGCVAGASILVILLSAAYFLMPGRSNLLVLGIDYTPPWHAIGRSDTIILTTFVPSRSYIGMLSIPRDLWVAIPGVGENRINTAHFFAESQQPGSGPYAAMQTIETNFGVAVDYYIRIRFEGFKEMVNTLGGLVIELPEPMAGYPAGRHHLTGNKALAFVRDRSNSDDFFRMAHGQFLVKALMRQLLNPNSWPRLPGVAIALSHSIDTNVPAFLWPRLAFTALRLGPDGIDSRIIARDMVTPYTTDQGASVLLPDWSAITPILLEMFGQ